MRPGFGHCDADGRKGSPVATTDEVAGETSITVILLAGSRSGTNNEACG